MKTIKKTVDMNARVNNLKYKVETEKNTAYALVEFENMSFGKMTAIKFVGIGYNSFGDLINVNGKTEFDIVFQDLNVNPSARERCKTVLPDSNIRNIKLKVSQICYANGTIITVKNEDIVEYDIDIFSDTWVSGNTFERDAKELLRETSSQAICFPKHHVKGWICICGYLNKNTDAICNKCGSKQVYVFEECNETVVQEKVIENNRRKEEERVQKEKEKERLAEEKRKRQNRIVISIIVVIASALAIFMAYRSQFKLSKEDKKAYDIAQANYRKIEYFIMGLSNDYYEVASSYDAASSGKDYSMVAENDEDYTHSRGLYMGSTLLYDLIGEQYPEKYQPIFEKVVKTRKKKEMHNINEIEALYVEGWASKSLMEDADKLEDAVENIDEYLSDEILNPSKVKYKKEPSVDVDYKYANGINIGAIFNEDGSLLYIGEYANGKAEGYGEFWSYSMDGESNWYEGEFEDGKAVEDDTIVCEGEIISVKGISTDKNKKQVETADSSHDEEKAKRVADEYCSLVKSKQSTIISMSYTGECDSFGDVYYFNYKVKYSQGLERIGTVKIQKNSNGGFEALGMDY